MLKTLALLTFAVAAAAQTPTIAAGGVVNGASFTPQLCPGVAADIFGTNLGTNTANVTVTVGGNPAHLVYVSASQLIVQIPFETAVGATTLIVTVNGVASAPYSLTLATYAPAIFTQSGAGVGAAAALESAETIVTTAAPAKPGDTLSVYATGLGPTNPATPTGTTPATPTPTATAPTLTVAGVAAEVIFAGLAAPSEYQVNFIVPAGVQGTQPIILTIGGISSSSAVTLPIMQYSLCDLKQAGNVGVADVQLIINEALGVAPVVYDLSGGGVANVVDVQIEINAALGLGCAATLPGLVAYWPGNNSAVDVISGLSGTLVNGATFGPGAVGASEAFSLNGTNSYVQAAGSATISGPRTLAAWVFPKSSSGLGMPVLTGGSPGAGDLWGITGTTGNCDGSGQYNLYIDHWGTSCYISSNSLAPNAWSHVAAVFDGTTIQFYINGVASQPIAGQMYNYGVSTYAIGGNTIGGSTTNPSFNGLMDQIQVYGRALTSSEIQPLAAPTTAH